MAALVVVEHEFGLVVAGVGAFGAGTAEHGAERVLGVDQQAVEGLRSRIVMCPCR